MSLEGQIRATLAFDEWWNESPLSADIITRLENLGMPLDVAKTMLQEAFTVGWSMAVTEIVENLKKGDQGAG